ncbi:TniQ family protein [Leptolyngbya ohadii]|uniref:TniQ family protein n=1 Tax=Leptolyngbya ohadii TaxID=1962290 RepID=UPI000B5A2044|nr:TniQ family protein [Leptolyngbya ohadii]
MVDETDEEFELPRWCPEPFEGESIGSYLVRFRSQEISSMSTIGSLSRALKLGTTLGRWEKLRFNPSPSMEEIEIFCNYIGLAVEKLIPTFPAKGRRTTPEPIRFCASCYAEATYHRLEWQDKAIANCPKHQEPLLHQCPGCERPFSIPELLQGDQCKCGLYFRRMAEHRERFQRRKLAKRLNRQTH